VSLAGSSIFAAIGAKRIGGRVAVDYSNLTILLAERLGGNAVNTKLPASPKPSWSNANGNWNDEISRNHSLSLWRIGSLAKRPSTILQNKR
jgi:hypothetical protein